jgi:hypothetical protein
MIAYGIKDKTIGYIVLPVYGISIDELLFRRSSHSFSLKTVAMIGV